MIVRLEDWNEFQSNLGLHFAFLAFFNQTKVNFFFVGWVRTYLVVYKTD